MKNASLLRGVGQILVELGPAIVFMASYNIARQDDPDGAIFLATGLFMVATVVTLAFALFVQRRVPALLLVGGALILTFGALTLILREDVFIKVQPTIVNGLFAIALVISLLLKRNVWKLMFQSVFTLPDEIWNVLAWRWAGFYAALAIVNEVIWRTQSEAFWTASKLFVVVPATVAFMLLNLPITLKWLGKTTTR